MVSLTGALGFPSSENTWETALNLEGTEQFLLYKQKALEALEKGDDEKKPKVQKKKQKPASPRPSKRKNNVAEKPNPAEEPAPEKKKKVKEEPVKDVKKAEEEAASQALKDEFAYLADFDFGDEEEEEEGEDEIYEVENILAHKGKGVRENLSYFC
jgi:outer membrane biosynthesis protein TonB